MSAGFTEDDMRRALGLDLPATPVQPEVEFDVEPAPEKIAPVVKKAAAPAKAPSPPEAARPRTELSTGPTHGVQPNEKVKPRK